MTRLQIEIGDEVAEVVRERARLAGKTLEAWAAEILTQQATPPNDKEWIAKFLEAAKSSGGNSRGWRWNREELYDR